ncbi:MAG: hypothetical protein KatS3mg110_2495 [Pirellulaceae bacterium]|nr:MAG: hypothetical protein KatS3mg110_2495 [Pirellulaceae bacterium]
MEDYSAGCRADSCPWVGCVGWDRAGEPCRMEPERRAFGGASNAESSDYGRRVIMGNVLQLP